MISDVFGRGYGTMNRLIFSLFPKEADRQCVAKIAADSQFFFTISDKYWSPLLSRKFVYEPDIETLLAGIKDLDFAFIDLGANFGYWSILVSSADFGPKRVVSVEFDPSNYDKLLRHAAANENRFEPVHAAIYDRDGVQVSVSEGHHSARHIADGAADGAGSNSDGAVPTLTIETLVRQRGLGDVPLLLKLDIEGAEERGFRGVGDLSLSKLAFIYEEHGKDREHSLTTYLLNDGRFDCYFLLDTGKLIQIHAVSRLTGLKRNLYRGYNMLALPAARSSGDLASEILARQTLDETTP